LKMNGNVLHFYAGGNTSQGFANLFDSSLQGLDRLYILKGGPGTGKSTIIREIGDFINKQGFDIWLLHCASDNDSLDGLIVPALKAGIVDGTAPHVIEPKVPGAVEQYVNLGEAWDSAKLTERRAEIERIGAEIQSAYDRAYAGFAEALRIHDEWEAIYIEHMDFEKADQLTQDLKGKLFGDGRLEKKATVYRRFLGAATPKGAADFVPNLTEGLKRYLIKGRAGSGKSTMLKKLAAEAEARGFDAEIYHCGFDPNSLDMVVVRELGFAIFDSTAPHEYFPDRDTDEIIDMYELCIEPGTDERYASEVADISARYKAKMKASTGHLAEAKALHDELEAIYVSAMDFRVVDRMKEQIRQELEALAALQA
jgi:hypothetical protein